MASRCASESGTSSMPASASFFLSFSIASSYELLGAFDMILMIWRKERWHATTRDVEPGDRRRYRPVGVRRGRGLTTAWLRPVARCRVDGGGPVGFRRRARVRW